MLIRCTREFRDMKANVVRSVGEEWEATPERLRAINSAGYGKLAEAVEEGDAPDIDAMTVRQLVELCIREDVETVGRPKKAELVALLKAHYGME